MALPFLHSTSRKKPDQMLSIDLGGRTTKVVAMQRKGTGYMLTNYALLDAPIFERDPSADLLAEHFKQVSGVIDTKIKYVTVALGVNESLVRHVEMPQMPPDDMRLVLKNNARMYLQQDLNGYVFDAVVTSRSVPGEQVVPGQKNKVVVAGAKQELVNNLQMAARSAGWVADTIIPGLIAPLNAFEAAMPQEFSNDAFALVDIGFKNSTICMVQQGELILSRVVSIGGDRLTAGLAESLNISYAEAEGIKVGMPDEVRANLEPLLMPLGNELRASIDFFEHQQDRVVSTVYICGGSSTSEFVLQMLKEQLMKECKIWNPLVSLQKTLSPQKATELEHIAPKLSVAIGAALTAL